MNSPAGQAHAGLNAGFILLSGGEIDNDPEPFGPFENLPIMYYEAGFYFCEGEFYQTAHSVPTGVAYNVSAYFAVTTNGTSDGNEAVCAVTFYINNDFYTDVGIVTALGIPQYERFSTLFTPTQSTLEVGFFFECAQVNQYDQIGLYLDDVSFIAVPT
jgi:hypothetical protein